MRILIATILILLSSVFACDHSLEVKPVDIGGTVADIQYGQDSHHYNYVVTFDDGKTFQLETETFTVCPLVIGKTYHEIAYDSSRGILIYKELE